MGSVRFRARRRITVKQSFMIRSLRLFGACDLRVEILLDCNLLSAWRLHGTTTAIRVFPNDSKSHKLVPSTRHEIPLGIRRALEIFAAMLLKIEFKGRAAFALH